jgi:hypothetical protein
MNDVKRECFCEKQKNANLVASWKIIVIIIIIGTTTHKESWPPSEVFSTILDSWLLPTNSLIPASLRPFPLVER